MSGQGVEARSLVRLAASQVDVRAPQPDHDPPVTATPLRLRDALDGTPVREDRGNGGDEPAKQAFTVDQTTVPIRDAAAAIPRRPPRKPRWMPPRDRRDAGGLGAPQAEGWREPAILTSPEGAVRVSFNYRNRVASTSARFSVRAGAMVYCEELHEKRLARDLETRAVRAFVMQPANLSWRTATGGRRSITLDAAAQELDGSVWMGEVKAHRAFFRDPAVRDVLDEAERLLEPFDITLRRISGEQFQDRAQLLRTDTVHRHRGVAFDDTDVVLVDEVIDRFGGAAPRGAVLEALREPPRLAEAMLDAMLVHRRIVFAIDRPVTGDTPVTGWPVLPPGSKPLRHMLTELSSRSDRGC